MVDQLGYYNRREISNTNHSIPSFSSTLLDAIYRSIDQGEREDIPMYGGETMRKKQQHTGAAFQTEEEIANFQRACMIEKWMEKKAREKTAARRKSTAAEPVSGSSSCEYSGGGGGGAESFWPKPIRVCDSGGLINKEIKSASKNQDGFTKTKSRPALKIYADLKKMKQPISPGARLAGFLNSLFAAGNTKKPKMNINPAGPDSPFSKSANASSTCSSASSFSRPCLSKTPPSARGKPAGGEPKRSVRFSPVTVPEQMDATRRKKNLEAINEEILMVHANVIESNRRVEQVAARDFLIRKYGKNEPRFDRLPTKSHDLDREFDDYEDDNDDDAASYASSDLFELDNLSAIGMERYREELPVYETTHLHTNRAIASGLIM